MNAGSFYSMKNISGKSSSDSPIYLGGVAFRVNQDGTGLRLIGHNFRNSYEQAVSSLVIFRMIMMTLRQAVLHGSWNMETWASLPKTDYANGK